MTQQERGVEQGRRVTAAKRRVRVEVRGCLVKVSEVVAVEV